MNLSQGYLVLVLLALRAASSARSLRVAAAFLATSDRCSGVSNARPRSCFLGSVVLRVALRFEGSGVVFF